MLAGLATVLNFFLAQAALLILGNTLKTEKASLVLGIN